MVLKNLDFALGVQCLQGSSLCGPAIHIAPMSTLRSTRLEHYRYCPAAKAKAREASWMTDGESRYHVHACGSIVTSNSQERPALQVATRAVHFLAEMRAFATQNTETPTSCEPEHSMNGSRQERRVSPRLVPVV